MLANRVQETTTSTGTGNLTLAGAAANSQTFNTAFGTSRPFFYFVIDDTNNAWEYGIGHLSASTTLVRDTVINSSNSDSAVSFAAGTKSVFSGPGADQIGFSRPSKFPANHVLVSPHVSISALSNLTVAADRIYYTPMLVDFYQSIDGIGTGIATANGAKCRFGIYTNGAGNNPETLIAQTADVTQSNSSFSEGSITATRLPPGWYWLAFVSDGADVLRAYDYRYVADSLLGIGSANSNIGTGMYYHETAASWTTLPSTAGALTLVNNNYMPKLGLRLV